jgi:hypothetical protein
MQHTHYCVAGTIPNHNYSGRAPGAAVFEVIADVQPRHFPFLAFLHGCGLDHGHHQYVDVVAREPCECG